MRSNYCKAAARKTAILAVTVLLLAAGTCFAQSVNLTAARQTTALPDGNTVPMWGWTCGTASGATCTALNGTAQAGGTIWQPPLITVPTGGNLSITLTNSLPVETSLMIVGQLGGGLGSPVRESGPRTDGAHAGQTETTWTTNIPATFTPPAQGARARSFVPEAGPLSGSATYTWSALKPGSYLIETGTYPSIQGPMGLYGVLVVTANAGTLFSAGTAYPNIKYDADVPLLLSEIDSVQNAAADKAVQTAGFSETAKWTPTCGAAYTCYPAAVNFTPLYYLVNGVSFDKTAMTSSAAPIAAAAATGNVLLRFVNAGLRMHVPSVNGLPMSLIAEDSNVLPDVVLAAAASKPLTVRVQSDVFLAAGKVYDIMVRPATTTVVNSTTPAFNPANYQVFDRQLSLSTNGARDGGMQTLLQVAGGAATSAASAKANPDQYSCIPGMTLVVSDPGIGVIANDVNVYGVTLTGNPANKTLTLTNGTVTLNPNGTFTYTPLASATTCGDTFTYYANGNTTNPNLTATVTIGLSSTIGKKPTANPDSYTSNISSLLRVAAPGVLTNDTDPSNYPLCAAPVGATSCPTTGQTISITGATLLLNPDGSFTATPTTPPTTGTTTAIFQYQAINSENQASNATTLTITFQAGSGLRVRVQDAQTPATQITDYKWIIEQDRTFHINPATQVNTGTGAPPTLGTNFHTSYMPVVAVGCTGPQSCERNQTVYNPATGTHVPAICDGGICVPASGTLPMTTPDQVQLPTVDANGNPIYYYISVLPGDAANSFNTGNALPPTPANCAAGTTPTGQSLTTNCGHTMGGAPVSPICTTGTPATCTLPAQVTVNVEPNPLPTATVTVFVFEDDTPLNGEPDTGGGVDTYPTQEVGLEDFQVILWDDAGGSGDATGQMTYDMFNMPLTNALNGTLDPATGNDACPISNAQGVAPAVGVVIVCPKFESDGVTPSPLVGQAVIKNLMPGRFGIIVHPGAGRESRGEEWLQTNTLDGTHFLDSFVKMAEPAYFQEFGPGGWHVFMGMANPAIINQRLAGMCGSGGVAPCNNTIHGQVTNLHQSRSPNEQLFSSGVFPQGDPRNYAPLNYTTCYAALGDSDGATFAFTKCDADGNFTFAGIPDGNWGLVIFDQWLDLIVDGSSKSVNVQGGQTLNLNYAAFTWQTHLWANSYMDLNGNGVQDPGEPGLIQIPTRVRMRNGKFNNSTLTNFAGLAHFDETFPLFNWYVTESDTTRFRGTGVHVVNDAGGQVDGPTPNGNGNTGPYQGILNSKESISVPTNLRVPGAVYCGAGDAACSQNNFANLPNGGGPGGSTGRIDPGTVVTEGWQGGLSQFNMIEWGKLPYVPGENGGIRGHVVYSSTRPFDDPTLLFQNLWEPLVPGVTINLYAESTGPDGTTTLTLVDTTKTSSWDDWAQGFRADGVTPNMSCPGQDTADPFYSYTLSGTRNYLSPATALPSNSQYKCFDGYHNLNQIQPAPYDGLYQFPSPFCVNNPGGTFTAPSGVTIKCATVANPALQVTPHTGAVSAVLPIGKYVVEAVTPPNYEITKEEDKNILIGDNFIAPVTQQFGAIVNIFIVPDQATINNGNPSYTGPYSSTNPYFVNGIPQGNIGNPTTDMGRTNLGDFGPGGLIVMPAPCVGQLRIVPDFMSISPESGEVAPFAGASRHLCDRKEVTLEDRMQAQTDFFIWTKTPAASHFTGFISDDFSSEFDPTSPAFGEKFAVPNVPVSIKDYNGVEISRGYSDQFGIFNGLTYSTWQVNPPNPTGYAPNMMITCMNDPGPVPGPNGTMIADPLYNPNYSNFCYENPFMPADTAYLDTPVVPTAAFAEGYNTPDCAYPDATPAVKEVDGDGIGPWMSATGARTLTITALGDQLVPNHAYSGPAASVPPYNQKFITRHYGFGSRPSTCPATGNCPNVTVGGVALTNVNWSDTTITGTVPLSVPACSRLQSNVPAGTTQEQCGELVITAANGRQSIDSVTVTIGGKAPTRVQPGQTIQSVIDGATPGDLLIVPPGTYNELVLMWKPVRLQGVGAASTVVNANAHPAGKLLEPWRRKVNCLFGLALNGGFINNTLNTKGQPTNPYDPSNAYPNQFPSGECPFYGSVSGQVTSQGVVDGLPGESVVGWTPSLNGNIAQLLQEPTLMGAYEGAAITVLAKGLENSNTANCAPLATLACIPLNNSTAAGGDCNPSSAFYGSNYLCNPARIDGMGFTNSSQGGGGIFLHGWVHYTEVSNNRVFSNAGTLGGGIVVGLPETPETATIDANGNQGPYLQNHDVYMHNNSVTTNTSYGDELNSVTPASAAGAVFCDGTDYYRFQYNWVCGNLSSGDGGGVSHFGFSFNGDIEHNSILFNQSKNPTITTHGGGIIAQGIGPDNTGCENAKSDLDCSPGLTEGVGPNLTINANLIMGNTAESGSGGGIRLQHVNGGDVQRNPSDSSKWYQATVTNNIIAGNVAGWVGGGVSLHNAVKVNFINNTVVSNDTTATAGVLFDTLGAPGANVPPPGCDPTLPNGPTNNCTNNAVTQSNPLPAGFATESHDATLAAVFTNPNVNCGAGHSQCTKFSNPVLDNNLFWQNRSFHITTGAIPTTPGLQTTVQLVPALNQTTTGACPTGATYWDIGVYGDTSATNHGSGLTLNPLYSILTNASGYSGTNLAPASPGVVSQSCNGSRVPAEIAPQLCTSAANAAGCIQPGTVGVGMTVPPGVPDINQFYPAFTLLPAATVDEGNNWINMFYGPLSLSNATRTPGQAGYSEMLGNYALTAGSPAQSRGLASVAPPRDFFGNLRTNPPDIGAVEFVSAAAGSLLPGSLNFGTVPVSLSTALSVTVNNTGNVVLSVSAPTLSGTNANQFSITSNTCGTSLAIAGSCTIGVTFAPTSAGAFSASLTVTLGGAAQSVSLTGTGVAVPLFTVSGTISPAASGSGTVVTLAPGNFSGTANASGAYTVTVPAGSYTATPSKTGFTFSPASAAVSVTTANVTGVNFTATSSGIGIDAVASRDINTAGTTIALNAATALTTAGANELLVAFIATDAPATGTNAAVTSVSNNGTALTWTLARRTNAQRGTAEIWWAFATTVRTGLTVTATMNESVAAGSITVIAFTGTGTGADAIGATGTGNAASGAPSASLTTTRANSLVLGVGNDWDNASARTVPANQTMVHQDLAVGAGDAYWVQRMSAPTPASGLVVIINDTAPTTDRFNLSSVEVRVPGAVPVTFQISGAITPATSGVGSTVTLTQGTTTVATVTADASGNYSFTGLANGGYTVTPTKAGFVFTPASLNVTVAGASVTGVNFTIAAAPTFPISGSITPAASSVGSTVTLTQGATTVATTTVAANGTFSFTPVVNGAYTVTPSKAGFTFTPTSQNVTVAGAPVTGVAFTIAGSTGLTIDAVASGDRSVTATTIVTPAFSTTSSPEVLLAFISADNPSGGGTNTTVTGVAGGGLTWTLVARSNGQLGTAEVWRALANATLTNAVVTGTLSQSAAASITVVAFRGTDTTGTNGSGAIGATASLSAATGAPSGSVVTTRANSWVFMVGTDWDNATARSLGPNQTMVHQFLPTVGDTYWVQRQNAPTPTLGTTVVMNDTAPTADRWDIVIVEVRTP